jgi:hypothetical protein
VALWWLDHPEVSPEVPLQVLSRMVGGLIGVGRLDTDTEVS